ncbi:MAG: PD40 domain-containing protein, partial [Anaerolineae bacterium]|nr:PD40 domain-containing protein [Anaerolineae bacterium]
VLVVALAGLTLLARDDGSAQAQGGEVLGPVVLASDRSGNYEIYILNSQTGLMTQLTNNAFNDIDPVWSPDGSLIAFVSDRDGDYELFVMRPDGTDVQQLTLNFADEGQPRWQPGGQHLIFASDVNGQWDLYAIAVETGLVQQLTNDPADERGPGAAEGGETVEPGPGPAAATPGQAVPDGVVDANSLNIRSNPGEGAQILTNVPRNTPLDIIGRRFDNTWLQVITPNNVTGWAFGGLIRVSIDLSTIPVVDAPFIAPPPTATPAPTASPVPQTIIEFWADRTTITAGECVTMSWRVEGIKAVYYQGTGVVGSGSRQECPAATTTYNLRVIRLDDVEDNRYITIVVNP